MRGLGDTYVRRRSLCPLRFASPILWQMGSQVGHGGENSRSQSLARVSQRRLKGRRVSRKRLRQRYRKFARNEIQPREAKYEYKPLRRICAKRCSERRECDLQIKATKQNDATNRGNFARSPQELWLTPSKKGRCTPCTYTIFVELWPASSRFGHLIRSDRLPARRLPGCRNLNY